MKGEVVRTFTPCSQGDCANCIGDKQEGGVKEKCDHFCHQSKPEMSSDFRDSWSNA